jgi:hypothetical protein
MTLPTLTQLLSHEEYASYFERNVRVYESTTQPWEITAQRRNGHWAVGFRDTFQEARDKVFTLLDSGLYVDASIIARNRIFRIPRFVDKLELMPIGSEWCGRCRRPTYFKYYAHTHHALKWAPIIVEGRFRCYYCGIDREQVEKENMRHIRMDQRKRLEHKRKQEKWQRRTVRRTRSSTA